MNILWQIIARTLASHPSLVDWIIRRALRTPYTHLTSADGSSVYMGRWWLFNPYDRDANDEQTPARIPWLPSVRIHHICRADQDRDLHDHPWNARTIVLRGWYREERPYESCGEDDIEQHCVEIYRPRSSVPPRRYYGPRRAVLNRNAGYTGPLLFGQYHRIREVSPGGVWTLFITGRKRGIWGFLVNDKKVPWRTYLGLDKQGT